MVMDEDEATRPPAAARWLEARSLESLSVAELEAYVEALKAEILRVEGTAAAKRSHRAGIEALFGKKP